MAKASIEDRLRNDVRPRHRGKVKRAVRKVGFYGCKGKVVRLEMSKMPDRQYPLRVVLSCPACKHEHDVKPFWRKWSEALDGEKDPDAWL